MKIKIIVRLAIINILSILSLDVIGQLNTFNEDQNFLSKFTKVIVLSSENSQQQLIVAPEYQGRIMTSTASGINGNSYGWINDSFIKAQKADININPFGGIDRLWIGPLGSQFSLYYQGKEFDDKYWRVPYDFDRKPFEVIDQGEDFVLMKSQMKFSNFIKTPFYIEIARRVNLFSSKEIEEHLNVQLPSNIHAVGFESINTMTNLGSDMNIDSGMLALWSLAQIQGNDKTAIIIPYKNEGKLNEYLADIPEDRLVIHENFVLFKGDGMFRSKIGTPPEITIPIFGALDLANNLLTIIQFQFENEDRYFNSDLGYQEKPYKGDVISVYNNNPETKDGEASHSFYELESASAMKALKNHAKMKHFHRTFHIEADRATLNKFTQALFGVGLRAIEDFLSLD